MRRSLLLRASNNDPGTNCARAASGDALEQESRAAADWNDCRRFELDSRLRRGRRTSSLSNGYEKAFGSAVAAFGAHSSGDRCQERY